VKDEFCKGLVYRYQRAIVSTSANISGSTSPIDFASISTEIKDQVDYILQAPQAKKASTKPSKIVRLGLGGEFTLIRS
jgi:L-threonylcarbamoyladenylate synthase